MFYSDYLDYLTNELHRSPRTIEGYTSDLDAFESFCKESFAKTAPEAIDRNDLRLWVADMAASQLSPASIARKISAVRSFYTYLVRRRGLKANPADGLTGPKRRKPLPAFVPQQQSKQIIDSYVADDSGVFTIVRDELIVAMLYNTGMRAAELIGLKDYDVDCRRGELKVLGKRNKERVIPFGNELAAMIDNYRTLRTETIGTAAPTEFFTRPDGRPLYYRIVYLAVRRALESADVRSARRSPHVLRHSFATDMLNNGADIASVRQLLGHASLRTTQQYTHLSYRELQLNYKQAHPRALKKED